MSKTEQTCRALIAAARPTAAVVALLGCVILSQPLPDWQRVFSWQTAAGVSLFGYAVFILFPIHRLDSITFWLTVAIGALLAVGSLWMSWVLYQAAVVDLLKGAIVFHAIAWIILIPFYAYIPAIILSRKYAAADGETVGQAVPETAEPEDESGRRSTTNVTILMEARVKTLRQ